MSTVKSKAAVKYDNAVSRARGEAEAPLMSGDDQAALIASGVASMISDTNMAELATMLNSGQYEAAPQLVTLLKGQTIRGELEGNGPQVEFVDQDTGEVSIVNTWIIKHGAVRASILSSVQLDKKLPPFLGDMVSITRGEDKNHGRKRYTDYLVIGRKRSDGSSRNWTVKAGALFVQNANAPQLPAPAPVEAPSDAHEALLDG